MPFYFRKSVSAGPFRFNFSKGGVGVSVGVTGLRFGTGPKGHYVHAGRGGLYYRSSFSSKAKGRKDDEFTPPSSAEPRDPPVYNEPNVAMLAVSSGDVLAMQDARFSDLLAELNAKQNAISRVWLAGGIFAALGFIIGGVVGSGVGGLIVGGAMGAAIGAWLNEFQRSAVLVYDLEDDAQAAYQNLTSAFDDLAACAGKWHIDSGGAVVDPHTRKRNAGASHLLDRRPTVFEYALPRALKTNITPPALKVGKETLYLLPDVMLVVENTKIGAVAYDSLEMRWQNSNFIEEGDVPNDAQVVGQTWKYPNKNGGPDRRFSDNRQLPVCLYETIYLTSSNGLNEMLQVSRSGMAGPFAQAIRFLGAATGKSNADAALPRL